MDFMDLKFHLWLISKTLKKKKFKKKPPQKQSREIHTCNSLDGRFDKEFYYGFQKHQIAYVIRGEKKQTNKQRRVRFLNNIKIVREWELLMMGERKEEEEVVPKNI